MIRNFSWLARIVLVAAPLVVFNVVEAQALGVKDASVSGGAISVSGNQAVPYATIVWEGVEVTTANRRGAFSFSTTLLPPDCVGTLSDGSSILEVVVGGCAGAPAALPATGQTISYAANDDGDLQAGSALSYTDNGDGTVTDNNTGLTWEKKTDANVNENYSWQGALDYAAGLNAMNNGAGFAGHNDWRLPNMRELLSILDYSQPETLIHPTFGPTAGTLYYVSYWSSTSWAAFQPQGNAWAVEFHVVYGNVNGAMPFGKSSALHVRAVRGGLVR